jgi:hypothetical protein
LGTRPKEIRPRAGDEINGAVELSVAVVSGGGGWGQQSKSRGRIRSRMKNRIKIMSKIKSTIKIKSRIMNR